MILTYNPMPCGKGPRLRENRCGSVSKLLNMGQGSSSIPQGCFLE